MAPPRTVFLWIGLALPGSVAAQEPPGSRNAASSPDTGVRLEQVRATATISDGTATTEVEQVFRNADPVEREEVFLFPLPEDSVVSDLSARIDGKSVKGEVLDRSQARAVYEGI